MHDGVSTEHSVGLRLQALLFTLVQESAAMQAGKQVAASALIMATTAESLGTLSSELSVVLFSSAAVIFMPDTLLVLLLIGLWAVSRCWQRRSGVTLVSSSTQTEDDDHVVHQMLPHASVQDCMSRMIAMAWSAVGTLLRHVSCAGCGLRCECPHCRQV